jgi:hypothetical protein
MEEKQTRLDRLIGFYPEVENVFYYQIGTTIGWEMMRNTDNMFGDEIFYNSFMEDLVEEMNLKTRIQ